MSAWRGGIWLLAATAFAVPVQLGAQVRQIPGGRALDANPMVGSGGYNVSARTYRINQGNLIITGNVTGGRAFRGYSPIRDSSQLLLDLPSSTLSNFVRDSVGVNDVLAGRTFEPRPYFDPQQTVTNVGAIQAGLNRPGTSVPRSTSLVPRMDRSLPPAPLLAVPAPGVQPVPQGDRLLVKPFSAASASPAGQAAAVNPQLLGSPLFARNPNLATQAQTGLTPYSAGAQFESARSVVPSMTASPAGVSPPAGSRTDSSTPQARRTSLGSEPLGAGRVGAESLAEPMEGAPAASASPGIEIAAPEPAAPSGPQAGPAPAAPPAPAPPAGAQTFLSGADTFQDMLNALAFRQRLEQLRRTGRAEQTAGPQAPGASQEPAPTPRAVAPTTRRADADLAARRERVREFFAKPIRTFVGTAPTALNERLRQAETLLAKGQYFRAAGAYEIAHTLDPANPLPLLGRAHALIAAGQYLSAVNDLRRAILRFPDVARFRLDLRAFIPDAKLLEIRRADLEKVLQTREDYRLRFLLGYIEMHTGLEEFGLENLRRAAAAAPPGSPIARFLELVLLPSPQRHLRPHGYGQEPFVVSRWGLLTLPAGWPCVRTPAWYHAACPSWQV